MPDPDARVISNAQRQAELESRHRDLTKPIPPPGSDGDSIRSVKGFENITDQMLEERATFNLKEHMSKAVPVRSVDMDLTVMSPAELRGLAQAAEHQAAMNEKAQGAD